MLRIILTLSVLLTASSLAVVSDNSCMKTPKKVVVTGAGGQTGQALFRKMLALPDEFEPLGIVRTQESKDSLVETGVPSSRVAVVDIRDASALKTLVTAAGCDAFCIGTSAKPKPILGQTDPDSGRPIFSFPDGSPEEVDWIGQKNQIDACDPGTHIVVCSTMGGTNADHSLNSLGRVVNPDGTTTGGNIVKWKRKAEMYLMESGKPFTIVHPGGLINEPGGARELVVGVDDEMTGTDSRTVPREDVAEVMLQSLRYPEMYQGRSFDLRAKPEGDGTPTTDFDKLLESLSGRNCDYTLGETM